MRWLALLSLLALGLGLLPLALALAGLAYLSLAGCENPPFAQPAEGLCGTAEALTVYHWLVLTTWPLVALGLLGLVAWSGITLVRRVRGRR